MPGENAESSLRHPDIFPDDTALRAEYTTILIEEGQLEKARVLLGDKK